MEDSLSELQTWWEVPVIAHFCYVFRAAFNLFHFEIEELEAALLQQYVDVEQPFATIDQLIMRLLQGCYKKKISVLTSDNWEELLRDKLGEYLDGSKQVDQYCSFLKDKVPFENLQLKEKVDLLLILCEMRLDAENVADAIKDLDSSSLRIVPVGTDSKQNTYWYFFGIRLYKENLKRKEELQKEEEEKSKGKGRGRKPAPKTVVNKSKARANSRRSSRSTVTGNKVREPVWSVTCHSLEDWNALALSLRKSPSAEDKKLGKKLESDYIPDVSQVQDERERLSKLRLKRRIIELGPVRTSSRICVVRQRELAKEREAQLKEQENDEMELDLSAKRAAERQKAIEERAKRAKLRELRLQESENSNSSDAYSSQSPFQNGASENYADSSAGNSTSAEPSDNNSGNDQDSSEEDSDEEAESDPSYTSVPQKPQQYTVKNVTEATRSQKPRQYTVKTVAEAARSQKAQQYTVKSVAEVARSQKPRPCTIKALIEVPRPQITQQYVLQTVTETPCPQKPQQYFVKTVTETSPHQSQTAVQEQTVAKVPLNITPTIYNPRNFYQPKGIKHGSIRASITYHNFNRFTFTKASPPSAPVYQRTAGQQILQLAHAPIVSFIQVQDSANTNSIT